MEFTHAYKPKSKHAQKYQGLTRFQKACEHKSKLEINQQLRHLQLCQKFNPVIKC